MILMFFLLMMTGSLLAQSGTGTPQTTLEFRPSELVHTYSIVAYDAKSGEIGAAVQSHWFSVGSIVIWAEAGIGAVATQSLVNPDYGPLGLDGMRAGKAPDALLKELLGKDLGQNFRQVAFVDAQGRVAAHSGTKCIDYACDLQGEGFSVQANIMLKPTVCQAMATAYRATEGKPLADRLLAALQAAEAEGGDLRGRQSAAMKIVSAERHEKPWLGVKLDLRVEDHSNPISELARILAVHKAYDAMNQGDLALEKNQTEQALNHYKTAVSLLPGQAEPLFWYAVNLVAMDQLDDALPLFAKVYALDENWRLMPDRLVKVGLLKAAPEVLSQIKHAGTKSPN